MLDQTEKYTLKSSFFVVPTDRGNWHAMEVERRTRMERWHEHWNSLQRERDYGARKPTDLNKEKQSDNFKKRANLPIGKDRGKLPAQRPCQLIRHSLQQRHQGSPSCFHGGRKKLQISPLEGTVRPQKLSVRLYWSRGRPWIDFLISQFMAQSLPVVIAYWIHGLDMAKREKRWAIASARNRSYR
jgi:hypothetical protein